MTPNEELAVKTERYAKLMEKPAKAAFKAGVARTLTHSDFSLAIEEIAMGNVPYLSGRIHERLSDVTVATDAFEAVVRDAFMGGAKVASTIMSANTIKKAVIDYKFDASLPDAIEAARANAARTVQGINRGTRAAIRQLVTEAFGEGMPPYELAEELQHIIGLSQPHSAAVTAYRRSLLTSGKTRATANRLAKQYAAGLLEYRANNIARTEMMTAANAGQKQYWLQARNQGFLPPNVQRVWIATPGTRTCPRCRALNGTYAPLEGWFPDGTELPPLHPSCRCTTGIAMVSKRSRLSKFNPFHDRIGRFATGPGGGGFGTTSMFIEGQGEYAGGGGAGGHTKLGLSLSDMGGVGEYLFVKYQGKSGVTRSFGKVSETSKTVQGQNPIDIVSRKYAIEVKTVSSSSKRPKVGIKAEEVASKEKAAKRMKRQGAVVAQLIDVNTGVVTVFAYKEGFRKVGAKSGTFEVKEPNMTKIGTYKVTNRDVQIALKSQGRTSKMLIEKVGKQVTDSFGNVFGPGDTMIEFEQVNGEWQARIYTLE